MSQKSPNGDTLSPRDGVGRRGVYWALRIQGATDVFLRRCLQLRQNPLACAFWGPSVV